MAQTGYTPILLYSSSTASAVPAVGSLTNSTLGSELAINITDGKLFYKDNTNNVQVIGWKVVPTTAGGTGLTSYVAGDLIYYASGTAFSKLAIGSTNSVMTSTGSAPQWSTSLSIISLSLSGNLTFTSVGTRIFGDFSNATPSNRVYFQTTTLNGNTSVGAIPLGTGNRGEFAAISASDPTNAIVTQLVALPTESSLRSAINGAAGYVPLTIYTGGSEKVKITEFGDVGIGVTMPAAKLDVNGVGWFRANTFGLAIDFIGRASDGTSVLRFLSSSSLTTYGSLTHNGTTFTLTNVLNQPLTLGTNNTDRVYITADGNVGVGVTPTGSGAGYTTFHVNNSTLGGQIHITGGGSGTAASDGTIITQATTELFINNQEAGPINFYVNGSERVRFDSAGNVGINTISPASKLDVRGANLSVGSADSLVQFKTTTSQAINVGASLQLGGLYDATTSVGFAEIAGRKENSTSGNSSGYLQFATRANGGIFSERMRITSAGDVGIGTNSPAYRLDVRSTAANTTNWIASVNESGTVPSAGFIMYCPGVTGLPYAYLVVDNAGNTSYVNTGVSGAGDMVFSNTGSERMRITSAGRVGIATPTPGEELHVVGQGYFTAGCYIGTNATTDNLIDDASNGAGSATLYIGNASITTSSDRRLKRNIRDSQIDALAKVKALRVVDFTWDDPSDKSWNNKNARGEWTGLIAQEAIEQVPWAVNAPRNPDTLQPLPEAKDEAGNDQYWFMEYQQMVPMLIKGMQEQQAQIETLKAEMAVLKGA